MANEIGIQVIRKLLLHNNHLHLVLNLVLVWLVLCLWAKLTQAKINLKHQLTQIKAKHHEETQITILEQAMLFDRELRKIQEQLSALKRQIQSLHAAFTAAPNGSPNESQDETDQPHDLMDSFILAKKKGLRRMCVIGRGWIPLKRVQLELGLSDSDVKSLCNA